MGLLVLLAWVASLASAWLVELTAGGRSALVVAVFLVAAGTPVASARPAPFARAALLVALSAAPLALAVALDLASGATLPVLLGLAPAWLALGPLAAAAARRSLLYASLWSGLVLALPLAWVVLGLARDGVHALVLAASPPAFALARAAQAEAFAATDLAPLAAALLLAATALRATRTEDAA